MSETLVKVENVSKKFCRDLKRSLWYGMRDLGSELFFLSHHVNGQLRKDEFWASKNVSFDLKRGECLSIIGRNGAGKTTLLRMLNGLIKPDSGRIEIRGRVGALIALGAGFNPVLTGRENIYVNASVLGLTKKEVEAKFDEIVYFAELGEFIDSPVQTYSSGMQVRLGFSIATALEPDILLLDEVLAVGDAAFRAKCYNKISECMKTSAVIFVSHNMEQVARVSTDGVVISNGEVLYNGNISRAIKIYNDIDCDKSKKNIDSFSKLFHPLKSALFLKDYFNIKQGEQLLIIFDVCSQKTIRNCWTRVVVFNALGGFSADIDMHSFPLNIRNGCSRITIYIDDIMLRAGAYRLGINIFTEKGEILLWSYKELELYVSTENHTGNAEYQLRGNTRIEYDS